jgi:hypothetical protein
MSILLLATVGALVAIDAEAHDCRPGRQVGARCPMAPLIAVVDDSHETKLPDVIRIDPEDSTDGMPKTFVAPTPAAPAATMATTCVTPNGSCALRAPASIGATCSCQSKTARVFGTAQ